MFLGLLVAAVEPVSLSTAFVKNVTGTVLEHIVQLATLHNANNVLYTLT